MTGDLEEGGNCVCVGKENSIGEGNGSQKKCRALYKEIDEGCGKYNQSLNETCSQKSNCICVSGKDKNKVGVKNTDSSANSTETKDDQCTAFQKQVDASCGRKNSNCICTKENSTTSPDGSNSTMTPDEKTQKRKKCKSLQKSLNTECKAIELPGYVPVQCKNNANCVCAANNNTTNGNNGTVDTK